MTPSTSKSDSHHHASTAINSFVGKLSPQARSLWAKSGDETGHLSLAQHLIDSACVAAVVYDTWVSNSLKENLAHNLKLSVEEVRRLYIWLAGLHDLGKGTLSFQGQLDLKPEFRHLLSRVADAGLPIAMSESEANRKSMPHSVSSGLILRNWLEREGYSRRLANWLSSTVDAHHGVASGEERDAINNVLSEYPPEWRAVHDEIIDAMTETVVVHDVLESLKSLRNPLAAEAQILTGLIVMADWIASNPDAFPMVVSGTQTERVKNGMRAIDLTVPWSPAQLSDDIHALFRDSFDWPATFQARPVQQAMADVAKTCDEPSLIILEAETGVGKTEAALAAAQIIAASNGAQGVYFAAPTMATANGLLERTMNWARNTTESGAVSSLYLAHSKNQLSTPFQDLRFRDVDEDASDPAANGEVVASSWMSGRRRGLLSNIVVGTVDQVLMLALRQRYSMLRHAALAGKIIIFDEVHSYGAYTSDYLATTLEWLAHYGATVIMMSATLPAAEREKLIKAYTANPVEKHSDAYPLITVASENSLRYVTPEQSPPNLEARIAIIDDSITALEELLEPLLFDGGVALIICNTIARAQEAYSTLNATYPGEVELHHAGFMAWQRSEKEDRMRQELGPDSHRGEGRPWRKIVVATQVAEQSLDIDADVLVTDLAPMDLIIQRIGRLHRHERPESDRPEQLRKPQVFIRAIESLEPAPIINSGANAVYDPLILLKTLLQLPTEFKRPDDVATLVQSTYSDGHVVPQEWEEVWAEASSQSEQRIDRAHQRSKSFRINSPLDTHILHDLFGDLTKATLQLGDEEKGAAQVRDAEPTVEVIPIQHAGDFYTPLDREEQIISGVPLSYKQAFQLASSTVRLPLRMTRFDSDFKAVIDALERSTPMEWNGHYLLKGQLALSLDTNGEASLGSFRVKYSPELGLESTFDSSGPDVGGRS